MKHIICYSGGHSSALVAIETVRKFGKENVILLNHDIASNVESSDIKRFKKQVAEYLGLEITFANIKGLNADSLPDQFEVVIDAKAFKVGNGSALCTSRLKTEPFMQYLKANFADKNCICYYGFDANETARIQRRSSIMGQLGYKTDYPLALWPTRTIASTKEIGIEPPNTYNVFKHGNCVGCLKAGRQHWYVTYVYRYDIFQKAKETEEIIGYTIIKDIGLDELEPMFAKMKLNNVPATEHIQAGEFWKIAKDAINAADSEQLDMFGRDDAKPCECTF